jgi:hypothetical protein
VGRQLQQELLSRRRARQASARREQKAHEARSGAHDAHAKLRIKLAGVSNAHDSENKLEVADSGSVQLFLAPASPALWGAYLPDLPHYLTDMCLFSSCSRIKWPKPFWQKPKRISQRQRRARLRRRLDEGA